MIIAKKQKFEKLFYGVCSLLCFVTMGLFICAKVFNPIKCYVTIIIAFGIGLLLLAISYRYIYNQCGIRINGVLKRYRRYSHVVFTFYIVYYEFKYDGKKYEVQDLQNYSKNKIDNFFAKGNVYEIFINQKDPIVYCVCKKFKNRAYIICLTFALVIAIFGIYRIIVT